MRTYTDRNMKEVSVEPESYLVANDKLNKPVFTGDTVIIIGDILGVQFIKITKKNCNYYTSQIKRSVKVSEEQLYGFVNYFNPFNYLKNDGDRVKYKPIIGDKVILKSHRYPGVVVNAENVIFVDVDMGNWIDKNVPIYEYTFEENIKNIRREKIEKINEL